jgi:hypothetical protein
MLVFSSKFPTSLKGTALLMHAKAVHSCNLVKAELIERLAADSRLDAVWVELTRRVRQDHRPTCEYSRPARPPDHAVAMNKEDAQATALAELFNCIIISVECCRLLPENHSTPIADFLRKKADRLRADGSRRSMTQANQLSRAAEICSEQPQPDSAKEIAIELATYLEARFGDKMYGTTATIVSVAWEKDITPAKVRGWCDASMSASGQNDQPQSYS